MLVQIVYIPHKIIKQIKNVISFPLSKLIKQIKNIISFPLFELKNQSFSKLKGFSHLHSKLQREYQLFEANQDLDQSPFYPMLGSKIKVDAKEAK